MKQKVHANKRAQILVLGFSFVTPSTSFGPQQKIYQMKEGTLLDNSGGGLHTAKNCISRSNQDRGFAKLRLVTPYRQMAQLASTYVGKVSSNSFIPLCFSSWMQNKLIAKNTHPSIGFRESISQVVETNASRSGHAALVVRRRR